MTMQDSDLARALLECAIRDAGARALAEALTHNRSLESLDLIGKCTRGGGECTQLWPDPRATPRELD